MAATTTRIGRWSGRISRLEVRWRWRRSRARAAEGIGFGLGSGRTRCKYTARTGLFSGHRKSFTGRHLSGASPPGRPSDYLVRRPAGRIQTASWKLRPDTPPESAVKRKAGLVGHFIRLCLWRRPGKADRLLQDRRPATQEETDEPARGTRRRAAPSLSPRPTRKHCSMGVKG